MPTPWNALAIKSGGTSGTTPLSARRALGISEGATTDNMVSVKDFPFRAVGDGVTDDTASIQAAIDAVHIAGGTLMLPSGIYKLNGTLIFTSGVNVQGDGRGVSVLSYVGSGIAVDTSYAGAVTTGVHFSDFTITSLTGTIGMRLQAAIAIKLERVEITSITRTAFTTAGLQISPVNAGNPALSIIIDDCDIHENNGFGIQALPSANDITNHIVVMNSRVRANSGNIRGTGELLSWTIIGNDLEAGNNTGAISFTDIFALTVIGNYFEQAGQTAIDLSVNAEVGGVVLAGNFIQGNNSGTAIILGGSQFLDAVSVKSNEMVGWALGISAIAVKGGDIGPNKFDSVTTNMTIAAGCSGLRISTLNNRVIITYSASMTADCALGTDFQITATNGTAFTINAPTNPADDMVRTFTIRNTSGGALGAATWNAVFKMSAWTNPANGNSRSITFRYDGTNWLQIAQTGVDVPN